MSTGSLAVLPCSVWGLLSEHILEFPSEKQESFPGPGFLGVSTYLDDGRWGVRGGNQII